MKRLDKLTSIINHYGGRHQMKKLGEETYELFEAVLNYKDEPSMKNIVAMAEEIADCKVLATQFMLRMGAMCGKMERVNEIISKRKVMGIKYSPLFLFTNFHEFAEEYIHDMNTNSNDLGWAMEKLCGYVATYETLAAEMNIDMDVIDDIMDRKIDRQIKRIKAEEKNSSAIKA